jgi:hypothetical protein
MPKRTGRQRPPGGYPREAQQKLIRLDKTIVAAIRAEATARNTTLEAVVARRFKVPFTPPRNKTKKPPSLDC